MLVRLSRVFVCIWLALFSAAAIAEESTQPRVIERDAILFEQIAAFLERFIDPDKTPSEQAAFFTDPVEYYDHGVIGKDRIKSDVAYYIRRWPWRTYRLAKIDYVTPDPDSDRVFVSYQVDFEVANPSRTVAGRASYGAVIIGLGGIPLIEAIEEKVSERQSLSTQGE